ncbi:hypothetical protein [Synechococcus sp. CC9902]|uniref:hypothetical protein n=1 Tax=Synechococcus sp. (strain CC9902) TaxID=316279 RepID=UPI00030EDEC2|nr:hypothetical protein [Synechococcus sp. CC9902]
MPRSDPASAGRAKRDHQRIPSCERYRTQERRAGLGPPQPAKPLQLTPMLRHYMKLKAANQNGFYRCWDDF